MKVSTGHMRHRLTIMELARVPDGGGGTSRADVVKATVYARVTTATPRELAAYGQLQQRITHIVTIRHRDDVRQGMTVVWLKAGAREPVAGAAIPNSTGNRVLYVLAATDADPDGRPGEFLKLACDERPTI